MVRKRYFVFAVCSLFVMTGCSGGLHREKGATVIMEVESECADTEKSDKEPELYEEADITTEGVSDLSENGCQTVEDGDIEISEKDNATDKNISAGDKSTETEISTEEKAMAEAEAVTEPAGKESASQKKSVAKSSDEDKNKVSDSNGATGDRGNPADGSPLYEISITKPETEFIGYNADRVTELATLKCKETGMITLPESLDSMLVAGEITKEEYDEYYPYDGCGYYSVFVETNLNTASTISGRKLGSEEEIADYIAAMMVLEREPYFYIECAGIYKNNGTEFYEFRCYR